MTSKKISIEQKRKLARLKQLKARADRGYRSNPILHAVRPYVHKKQKIFLMIDEMEVFYGGAAGGGKSDALLMAALQYIDVPNYSALLIRSTYANLSKNGGLMHRLDSWLSPYLKTHGIHKRNGGRKWEFDCPNGGVSSIEFGYLQNEGDEDNYLSAEYQYIGYDECTEIREEQYLALYGRIRRTRCEVHANNPDPSCTSCHRSASLSKIPLRCRAASNPGGKRKSGDGAYHGSWVKDRFVPTEYLKASIDKQFGSIWKVNDVCNDCEGSGLADKKKKIECVYCYGTGYRTRTFLPARAQDNPSLDQDEYKRNLANMTPFDRQRMEYGVWDIPIAGNIFHAQWFRYYRFHGKHIHAYTPDGVILHPENNLTYFMTADTASKAKTSADYTVICMWAFNRKTYDIFLIDCYRKKVIIPDIIAAVPDMFFAYQSVSAVVIEDKASGIGVIQALQNTLPIIPYNPGTVDKVSRASLASPYYHAGKVYHPGVTFSEKPKWLSDFEAELAGFDDMEYDDCVDNVSMAIDYIKMQGGPSEILPQTLELPVSHDQGTFSTSPEGKYLQ